MAGRRGPGERRVRLDPARRELLERQRQAFQAKFGRDPGPEDPVFFGPGADEPGPLDDEGLVATITAAMHAAGIDPAKIHAYRRTGMLVTRENFDQWSSEDLDDWQAALEEYETFAARRN